MHNYCPLETQAMDGGHFSMSKLIFEKRDAKLDGFTQFYKPTHLYLLTGSEGLLSILSRPHVWPMMICLEPAFTTHVLGKRVDGREVAGCGLKHPQGRLAWLMNTS